MAEPADSATAGAFERCAWARMEEAYEGYLRSLWRADLGCYVETNSAWLGEYHLYRCRANGWASDEDRQRVVQLVDYYLDPQRFGPREWTGHPAGFWGPWRLLCSGYRHREELGLPQSRAEGIQAVMAQALERHLWTPGSSWHGNQEAYGLYLTDCWYAYRAHREPRYWEWILHFLEEIKQRFDRSYVDDVAGERCHRFLQPDLTWNYANDRTTDGHPTNLHVPNYFDTHVGELMCAWQEIGEVVGHEDAWVDDHLRRLAELVFYDWMYDGSPSYFSSGYGIHRMHHGLTWASMLVFPVGLAYYRGTTLRGVGRFLLGQFLDAIPRYDAMAGDPVDGAIPAAYFGTRRFCGAKGEGNALWLQRLSKALVEYRVQEVQPEPLEAWVDFRDWNQGMHLSGRVFDLGVCGYQIRGNDQLGMQTALGEPTIRDVRSGRVVVASAMDPPNVEVPESGADFLLWERGGSPVWLTAAAANRRAAVSAFQGYPGGEWIPHLTPYSCHELDGLRRNPHGATVHTQLIQPRPPRFAAGNLVRATRDVVVQVSYLVNTQADLTVQATGKYYSYMRDEEAVVVAWSDGSEEELGWHQVFEFPAATERRVEWFWVRYSGYGMLFVPVWEEMEGVGEGWKLVLDRQTVNLGLYLSQGLGWYGLLMQGEPGDGRPLRRGEGWRTCVAMRPTGADLAEVREWAAFYCSRVGVAGPEVALGPRSLWVPGWEVPELKRGDRPWDVVVEGVRADRPFELSGPRGCGVLTVTVRGEFAGTRVCCAAEADRAWREVPCQRPAPEAVVFSLDWTSHRCVRVQIP